MQSSNIRIARPGVSPRYASVAHRGPTLPADLVSSAADLGSNCR